jgi:hypothetical protein
MYRCLGFMGIASPVPIYTCHVPLGLASRVFSSLYIVCSPLRARCQGQAVFAADPRLSTQSERDLGPPLVAFSLSRGRTLLQDLSRYTDGYMFGLAIVIVVYIAVFIVVLSFHCY